MKQFGRPALWVMLAVAATCTALILAMVLRANPEETQIVARSETPSSSPAMTDETGGTGETALAGETGETAATGGTGETAATGGTGRAEGTVGLPCGMVLSPVTEAQRKEAIELVSIAYDIGPDMVVEVESDVEVDGASCFSIYIGSPNAETTSTMEIYAVNLETNVIYLLDRVTGQYGQVTAVPFKEVMDEALKTILSSLMVSSNPGDYIKAHPAEVQTIVDLGDEALPYLMSIRDNGDRGLRGVITLELCLMIHPGLNIVSVDSPDGRFRLGATVILDTETMEVIELPTIANLQKSTNKDITERDFRPDPYFEVIQWVDDKWVEIGFHWVGQTIEEISGKYLFDVQEKSVKGLELTE